MRYLSNPRHLDTMGIKNALTNLRLFCGVTFFLFGLLVGTVTGLLILRKSWISIGVGVIVAGIGWLIRHEWIAEWRDAVSLYLVLGSFMTGFGLSITVFGLTREEV